MKKTQKSVQPCSIMYNENTISECVRKYILRRLVNFLVELQYFKWLGNSFHNTWCQNCGLSGRQGWSSKMVYLNDGLSPLTGVCTVAGCNASFSSLRVHANSTWRTVGVTGGHFGRRRTSTAIQPRAYRPSWMSDMEKFLKQCTAYAR